MCFWDPEEERETIWTTKFTIRVVACPSVPQMRRGQCIKLEFITEWYLVTPLKDPQMCKAALKEPLTTQLLNLPTRSPKK